MGAFIPHEQAWISETGRHFAMYDDQQNYFKALWSFLKG
jgi:proline iminopeptidase